MQIEFQIVGVITSVLLLFGVFDHTKHLALGAIKATLNYCVKIMTFQFILGLIFAITGQMLDNVIQVMGTNTLVDFITNFLATWVGILLTALMLCFIACKAGSIAQSVLSGTPGLSGGDLVRATTAAVAAGVTAGMTYAGMKAAAGGTGVGKLAEGAGQLGKGIANMFTGGANFVGGMAKSVAQGVRSGNVAGAAKNFLAVDCQGAIGQMKGGVQQMKAGGSTMGDGVSQAKAFAHEGFKVNSLYGKVAAAKDAIKGGSASGSVMSVLGQAVLGQQQGSYNTVKRHFDPEGKGNSQQQGQGQGPAPTPNRSSLNKDEEDEKK